MATSAAPTEATAYVSFHDIRSDDGTTLRAWTNDPGGAIDGPTVVLCNGLGTGPYLWPALLDPECGVRVVSWYHRGVGGSDRPTDPQHVEIEHFVEDALSVMDHFGIDRTVLMGWSMGVNTMFELQARHPERVSGLFAVAGVPGDSFATMFGPLRLPRLVVRALTTNLCRVGTFTGWALTPLTQRLPIGPRAVDLVSHSGFMLPVVDADLAALAFKEFLSTPVQWYAHLALGTSRHPRVSLSQVKVPVRFVAATYDVLAGARDMATAAERVADADYFELRASHFVQLEQPEVVHDLLVDFLEKVR